MNKKAANYMILGIVVGLILLLVVAALNITFLGKTKTVTEGAVVDSVCKTSLDLTAQKISLVGVTLLETGVQPKCKIYDVIITQKDINLIKASTGESYKDSIKRIIAQIMTKGITVTTLDENNKKKRTSVGGLFATVSQGEKQFFEDEAEKFCLPWATIGFDEDVQKNIKDVKGFFSYLKVTPMEEGGTTSYHGYLTRNLGDLASKSIKKSDKVVGSSELENLNLKNSFDTSRTYGLFYVQDVSHDWTFWLTLIGSRISPITTVGGYVLGSYLEGKGYSFFVALVEYDRRLGKRLECDVLK